MLFTMADNKELLCIVAASPLLIGRWSRCTKSHIVKLRQKHMSRKSLSVLCCLGHSCYPINNLYMYIYTVIPLPRIWMMSLCDVTKGSFLLVTPPPARCWFLPFETILCVCRRKFKSSILSGGCKQKAKYVVHWREFPEDPVMKRNNL